MKGRAEQEGRTTSRGPCHTVLGLKLWFLHLSPTCLGKSQPLGALVSASVAWLSQYIYIYIYYLVEFDFNVNTVIATISYKPSLCQVL